MVVAGPQNTSGSHGVSELPAFRYQTCGTPGSCNDFPWPTTSKRGRHNRHTQPAMARGARFPRQGHAARAFSSHWVYQRAFFLTLIRWSIGQHGCQGFQVPYEAH